MREHLKFLGALIVLFVIFACGSGEKKETSSNDNSSTTTSETKKEEPKEDTPELTTTPEEMHSDYEANEVSADGKYKGKIISISGNVNEIRKDLFDNIIVELKTSNEYDNIHCTLKSEFTEAAGKLKKGDKVTIVGTGNGKIMDPQMKDCSLK